jgi:Pro-kumamolisin, activation domain/Bacterial Ig-like domain (group 3)
MRVPGIHFRFKPSPAQSAELAQLLEDQQNPNSPLFHTWLTPEEYADGFGLSMNDLARVTDWLRTEGFEIDAVARSRTWITFSATGYDETTGLGSIDINNLFKNWTAGPSGPGVISTSVTASASPAILLISGSTTLSATVRAASGTALPTGTVTFSLGENVLGSAALSDSGGKATASITVPGSRLEPGDDTITVAYRAGSAFAPSTGSVFVTVLAPSGGSAAVTPAGDTESGVSASARCGRLLLELHLEAHRNCGSVLDSQQIHD